MKAGFEYRPLGSAVTLVMGQAPAGSDCNRNGIGTPFVKVGEFGVERPAIREWTTDPKKMARSTDVLICVVGATCGKINLGEDCAIGRSVAAIRPKVDVIEQRYLWYFMQGKVQEMRQGSQGAAQTVINREMISDLLIPLPPLDEQHRIVAVLDKVFAGIATATANAQKNLTNARALFESYLNSAFDQANTDWVHKPISSFARVYDGPHATPKTVDVGPVFLGISALQDGEINLGQTRHVTALDYDRWTKRVVPKAGDVVFSYETRLGQVAIVPEGLECCLGRRMGLVRLDRNQVIPMFFVYTYLAPPFQNLLKEKTIKGATVDRIALKDFPSFSMKIPSIDLQTEVVDVVLNMKSKIANLETVYQSKFTALSELKQSLLQKAFAGELT